MFLTIQKDVYQKCVYRHYTGDSVSKLLGVLSAFSVSVLLAESVVDMVLFCASTLNES